MTKEDEAGAKFEWSPGRFAWLLSNVRVIPPFRVSGKLGLYEVPYAERQSAVTEAA
jgi:hypothetical protein